MERTITLNVRLLRQKDLKSEHLQRCIEHVANKKKVKTVLDLQEAASNTLDKDQFLKNADDVAMPRKLWAFGAATSLELAPERTITSHNK